MPKVRAVPPPRDAMSAGTAPMRGSHPVFMRTSPRPPGVLTVDRPARARFRRGHNPAFPAFRAVGAAGFLCGPRNAVRMAGGNGAPASRPRVQSIEIESELTNTHLNLTETRRRPVEEPDARGAQRELPPSHQRRGSQGETKFQPRDPHPPNVMSRGTRNHRLTRLPSLPLDPARAVRHRPEAAMPRTRHHALAVPQGASRPQNTPGPSVAAKRPRYPPSAANGNFFFAWL